MTSFTRTSRTIAIITAVVGGLVLIGIGASAAIASLTTSNFNGEHGNQQLDITGVTDIEVESNSSQFTIEFADVAEATLTVQGDSRYVWDMRVDDTDLVVSSKSSLFDFCFFGCASGNERVTLTLPDSLADGRLSADLTVNAGSLRASGNFSDLGVEVHAGYLTFNGSADSIDTVINAGRAELEVDAVREVDFEVNAGRLTATLTGTAPRSTSIDLNAGSLDLTLPNAEYRVTSSVEVGKITNDLRVSPTSRNLVDATVEVGKLTLQSK